MHGEGLKGHCWDDRSSVTLFLLWRLLLLLSKSNIAALFPGLLAFVAQLHCDIPSLARRHHNDLVRRAGQLARGLPLGELVGLLNVELDLAVGLVPLLSDFGGVLLDLGRELCLIEIAAIIVAKTLESF